MDARDIRNDRDIPDGNIVVSSHRDPDGRLFQIDGRVVRLVHAVRKSNVQAFLELPRTSVLFENGELVRSNAIPDGAIPAAIRSSAEQGALFIEHEKIAFPSFPFEWPPEMIYAAGVLTLSLAKGYLNDGISLKDATPFNVLFRGPRPVFVDLLSFEERDPLDPVWRPEGQFVRTILLPLMANKFFGMPIAPIFLANRDGLEPENLAQFVGPVRRWLPPFLWNVTLPNLLSGSMKDPKVYRNRTTGNPEKARFLLDMLFRRLERTLRRLDPPKNRQSIWSDYERTHSYSDSDFDGKKSFLLHALDQYHPKRVLDVGCNEGLFSMLAADAGASVVAIDLDPIVAGRVWQAATDRNLDILPLVQNLSQPSPALGWRNQEFPSFIDRARKNFDLVLLLAVIHHLLVTERVPIEEIFDLVAEFTTSLAIVEYVGTDDPMFRTIARGRDSLFDDYNEESFIAAARHRFDVIDRRPLADTGRVLYLLELRV